MRSPYSTARWQKLRRAILRRDGRLCQIRGRRCTGIATTVHHILPASTHPHLFWEPSNLQAACKPCNYGDGAAVRADNRTARQHLAYLQSVVDEQEAELEDLRFRLKQAESNSAVRDVEARVPRIY
jgi:5-methylcytosine-specific restriction endonuclease McrA